MVEIRQLGADEAYGYIADLATVLLDCVEGGASVSFMAPLSRQQGEIFFENVVEDVRNGNRILLAAFTDNKLVGTVQIVTAMPPNQPHRADVAKLLVLRSARAQGVGSRLMNSVEIASRSAGKSLLVLDTVTGG